MPPFRKLTDAAPAKPATIADRLGEAAGLAAFATDTFRRAADDLETAARLHEQLADEATAVADEHFALVLAANAAAAQAQKQADKIRELIA